jgi:hypothetical protein
MFELWVDLLALVLNFLNLLTYSFVKVFAGYYEFIYVLPYFFHVNDKPMQSRNT